ncbi:hypothetical protein Pelo_8467 [Pelomyxa schiedti]|nr:hypothetical protein Pelo_8467 [Pelomyxa schiedti]
MTEHAGLHLSVRFPKEKETLDVELPQHATLSDLTSRVSVERKWPQAKTSFVYKGRKLRSLESTLLQSLGVVDGDTLFAILQSTPDPALPSHQLSCGTFSCDSLEPGENVDPVEMCKTLTKHLSSVVGSSPNPVGWETGLAYTRQLQNLPPVAPSQQELAQTLSQTCTSLSSIQSDLGKLSEMIATLTIGSPEWEAIREASTKLAPACQKTAVVLGIMGCTLVNFSGSSASGFLSMTPDGVVAIQATKIHRPTRPVVTPTAAHIPETPIRLYRGLDSSVLPAKDAIDSLKVHDHCVICYSHPQIALLIAVEHILRGLTLGAAFLILRSQKQIDDIFGILSQLGINTKLLLDSHRVNIVPNDCYTTPEMMGVKATVREQWGYEVCRKAMADSGKTLLHTIGEVPYFPSEPEPAAKKLFQDEMVAYEEKITKSVYQELDVRGCCFYDRNIFPPDFIEAIENAHPMKVGAV